MSGVVKGVGKVFKKAANVVKKVAPVALAAAAIYFTAGTALPALAGGASLSGAAAAGGSAWAGAATSVGSLLGGGPLAAAVTGAIQHAGYGALAGGLKAGLSGKNV